MSLENIKSKQMKYHYASIIMTKIKNNDNTNPDEHVYQEKLLFIVGANRNDTNWNRVWKLFIVSKTHFPYSIDLCPLVFVKKN
jgi:hypothetical protein